MSGSRVISEVAADVAGVSNALMTPDKLRQELGQRGVPKTLNILTRVLPKRFVNNVVRLCQEQEAMLVDGHRIPARWQKEEWDEGNDAGYMEA